ncbi:MAG: EamA family transporter [Patescibacteria group bacterium]|nr:EamA family transporter [Patescibacteria group bacterium]
MWVLIALLGHAFNGVAFIIDKILLNNAFKRSATYAGLVGLLSIFAIVLAPWVIDWPQGMTLFLTIVSGISFTTALWAFFAALSRGEASRVVPVISAFIPMLTLAGTTIFLHERLGTYELIGFFLLIVATVILSSGKSSERLTKQALILSGSSALLFAIMSVTIKAIYDDVGFLSGFVSTRVIAAITALIIVVILDAKAGQEIMTIFGINKKDKKAPINKGGSKGGMILKPKTAALLAIFGQTMGGLGFVGVQYAISIGSAAIVNSLQVMQFALLVIVAFIFKSKAKTLLGESLNKSVILKKAIALIIMAVGLGLIV